MHQIANNIFHYYNRYNKNSKIIKIKTNNLGFVDPINYQFNNENKKISITGDNSYISFNTDYKNSFNFNFRQKISNKINFYNFSQINYSTIQYYNFFLNNGLFKIINTHIYLYHPNHLRRTFTIHEPNRDVVFTQPILIEII